MIEKIREKQILLLWSVIGILLMLSLTLGWMFLFPHTEHHNRKSDYARNLDTGVSRLNKQELWVHQTESTNALIQKRLDAIDQALKMVLGQEIHNTASNPAKLNAPAVSKQSSTVSEITELQDNLKQGMQDLKSPTSAIAPESALTVPPQNNIPSPNAQALTNTTTQATPFSHNAQALSPALSAGAFNPLAATAPVTPRRKAGITKLQLSLTDTRQGKPLHTVDNYIPAGTHAQAILLSGVDASTATSSASDPTPVELRITSPGILPRKFQNDMEGCFVIAAAFGDLSSERVKMRLDKLACTERRTGEVWEFTLNGWVAGEDGKAGIRGVLVDRAGPVMRNAMLGGFISGMAGFLGQSQKSVVFSPAAGLAQTPSLSAKDILGQSAAQGAGAAMEKFADFYIKRAEQMQPVIEVSAGRQVDIIFKEGVDLSAALTRKSQSQLHDQERYQQMHASDPLKPIHHYTGVTP